MIVTETALPGVYTVDIEPHADERGFFARVWDGEVLAGHGLDARVSQSSIAFKESTVLAAYRVLRCRDWARIDVRCDEDGRPHVLAVNPLPGIHPAMNSCLPRAARAAGLDYPEMILSVLRAAAARHGLSL